MRPAEPPPAESAAPSPLVILMLDNSAHDREVLRRFLTSDLTREYIIHEFSEIEEALGACRQMKIDCVLLDYSLDDGTGLDFLAALRAIEGAEDCPVVMLTGSGNEDVVARAFRGGAQDYLEKGVISPETLQRTVAAVTYKAQAERLLAHQRREMERLFHEAREANARKDQFLAALSHELRTPLTPILAAVTEANPREMDAEELEEVFATVRRNVLLEARLIDDLLDMTRIASGKLSLHRYAVDAHEALRHALETCRAEITKKNLRLTTAFEAGTAVLSADAARLQQVFWNLIKNAVKFTPRDGTVQLATRNAGSGDFEFTICDTGIGIAAEVLPRIFNAFDQGSPEVSRRFGGLGLGLAIAHALVDAHGGDLHAESPGVGQGATFRVSLPVAVEGAAKPVANGPIESVAARQHAGHARILLLEDHEDTIQVLGRFLRRRGFDVEVARSVAEAVTIFGQKTFDLIVSDIGLPDASGLEAMRRMREIREVSGVALSGYGSEEDVARSLAAGYAAHLTKPVEFSQLEVALHQILGKLSAEAKAGA